jgi:hypothetical protein
MSNEQPQAEETKKPPKGAWEAKESFFDLKASHWVQIALTVVLGCIAYAQYSVYNRQAGIMDKQAIIAERQVRLTESDQRPWVYSDPIGGTIISKPLAFDSVNGGLIQISYALKNTGKSPALHTVWRSKLFAISMTKFVDEEFSEQQSALCDPLRTKSQGLLDVTIFAGDKLPFQGWENGLPKKDIEEALKARESGPFAHSGFISLGLIACIDYQSPVVSSEHHQTRYGFQLGIPMGDGSYMGDIKPEGTPDGIRLIYFSQSAD